MNYLSHVEDLVQQLGQVQLFEVGAKTAEPDAAEKAWQLFLNAHIPTAQYVDLNQDFCQLSIQLQYQCPTEAEMQASVQKFALDWHKPVVIYDRENHIWAARLFWVLKAYGHPQVTVLNGGFKFWQAQGLSIEKGSSCAPIALPFIAQKLQCNADYFVNLNEVKQLVEKNISIEDNSAQLLNVLRAVVYRGEELRYARAGHIPKSINIPFAEFLNEDGLFKTSSADFKAQLGLDLNREIIIYCGSGITASGAALALLQLHAKSVKIYDGSMFEWSTNPNLPLEVIR